MMMMIIIIRSISVCCKLDLCGPSSSASQHGGLRRLGTSEVQPLSAALSARCTLYTVLYTLYFILILNLHWTLHSHSRRRLDYAEPDHIVQKNLYKLGKPFLDVTLHIAEGLFKVLTQMDKCV